MASSARRDGIITGVGVTSAIGQGRESFTRALLAGESAFGVMSRPGRQKNTAFLGAEIASLQAPADIPQKLMRAASFSAQVALVTLHEAWHDARLHDVDPARVGLIVGGSNVQQRDLVLVHESYAQRTEFLRPSYAIGVFDSDLCGLCTEQFGIRGLAYTVGGASASGQLALIQALHAVQTGQVDACVALGALMDLSFWECRALASLGAMGSARFAAEPQRASRPFDRDRDGFIYGECCGAVVVEAESRVRPGVTPYARLAGCGLAMDAHRNPDPSLAGEIRAIEMALQQAECPPEQVDYVNPHGTGSLVGDTTELAALRSCGLSNSRINATKSIVGHGLTAAGALEVVATLVQMRAGKLHPTRNLDHPIETDWRWVRNAAEDCTIDAALTLSMGFGGINTALCLRRL